MKSKHEIYTRHELIERIYNHEDVSEFPEFFDENGDSVSGKSPDEHFILCWPEHSITRQCLTDASIHGPFSSLEDAEDYVK